MYTYCGSVMLRFEFENRILINLEEDVKQNIVLLSQRDTINWRFSEEI
jgi:hypothetical protein